MSSSSAAGGHGRQTRTWAEADLPTSVEDLKCRICPFVAENQLVLQMHVNQHKPFKCRMCSKLFWTVGGRKSHEDSEHNKVFRHVCRVCGKGYQGLYNYKGHMATHFAHLAEKCKKCGASFNYRGNRLRHERLCTASGPSEGRH